MPKSTNTDESLGKRIGDLYRRTAGLPERKSNAPLTNDDKGTDRVDLATEPQGGYGGKDGIRNTGAINATEERLHAELTERNERIPEDEPHQLASEVHHLPEAEKPSSLAEPVKPAKKAAAKKATAKR